MLSVFTVNSLADVVTADGLITLREALQAANTNTAVLDAPAGSATETDVIRFAESLFTDGTNPVPRTVTLGGTRLEATGNTQILGPGASLLAIDANQSSGVFIIRYCDVRLSGMTITGGSDTSGAGILNYGTLVVSDSVITGNAGNFGAGLCNLSSIVTIVNSSVSGNVAENNGGGVDGNVWLINSTVSGNTAGYYGGGVYGAVTATNSTITHNSASYGGGIYQNQTPLTVANCIVAENEASYSAPDIFLKETTFAPASGRNLVGVWDESTSPGVDSLWGTSQTPLAAGLTTITDEDGTILYARPNPESPVVDAGSGTLAVDPQGNPLTTDQLGDTRTVGAAVDIGAVEATGSLELVVTPTPALEVLEGTTAVVHVSLSAAPAVSVSVAIQKRAGDSADIASAVAALEFSPTNWNVPRPVVFSAAEDVNRDNDDLAIFAFSADGVETVRVSVSVRDNDSQVYVVNSLADTVSVNHLVTLREALQAANTNTAVGDAPEGCEGVADIVTFDPSLAGGTITLGGTVLEITEDLILNGLGPESLSVNADNRSGVFDIGRGVRATIDGLTIMGGFSGAGGGIHNHGFLNVTDAVVIGNRSDHHGGGLYSQEGSMDIVDSTVTGNTAEWNGGGCYLAGGTLTVTNATVSRNAGDYGAGIYTHYLAGPLSVTGSTISDNATVCGPGGGVYCGTATTVANSRILNNSAYDGGGGIQGDSHSLSILDSIIVGNHAYNRTGGGFYSGGDTTVCHSIIAGNWAETDGGGISADGVLTIVDSSVSGNEAGGSGGGIHYYGGEGGMTVLNSTVAKNVAAQDGGGIHSFCYFAGDAAIITNSTIVDNVAAVGGGGIFNLRNRLTLTNSVVARNEAAQDRDVSVTAADLDSRTDNNLIGVWDSPATPGASSATGTPASPLDPMLTTVVDPDGVRVLYYRPRFASPAIDLGSNELAVDPAGQPLFHDAIGNPRIVGAAVDAGAVELPQTPELDIAMAPTVEMMEGGSITISVMLTSVPQGTVAVAIDRSALGSESITTDRAALEFDITNWNVPQLVTLSAAVDLNGHTDYATFVFSSEGMGPVRVLAIAFDTGTQTYVVDSLGDTVAVDGTVTLREAILAANTNWPVGDAPAGNAGRADIITFAPELAGGTITLAGTQLEILDDLQIQGLGADILAVSANRLTRVFYVGPGVSASIDGLRITGGFAKDVDDYTREDQSGGGVFNSGILSISNCTVDGNSAQAPGCRGGGLYNASGTMTILHSMIVGNLIYRGSEGYGGGIANASGTMVIRDSTIANNEARLGGGIDNAGSDSSLSICDSRVMYNTCAAYGGGIYGESGQLIVTNTLVLANTSTSYEGGGIFGAGASIGYIANSCIAGNTAYRTGGGVFQASDCALTIINSAIVNNSAGTQGGGFYNATNKTLTLANTLVALNHAPTNPDLISSAAAFGTGTDYNLVGICNHPTSLGAHSICGTSSAPVDPRLSAILDDEGRVLYYRPAQDSPAVNAGSNALAVDADGNPLLTDLVRGPRIYQGTVEIGAVETWPQLVVSPTGQVTLTEGESVATTVALTAAPVGTVFVTIVKRDGGSDSIVAEPMELHFDATNWDTPQTVIVSALQDADLDNETAQFSLASPGMDVVYRSVSVIDDDFQTYVVDSLGDLVAADGVVTLREALQAANTNTAVGDVPAGRGDKKDVITFSPALAGGTITLSGTQLQILGDVEIRGLGADSLAIDANRRSRVFSISAGVTATVSELTLAGGSATEGGAIYNTAGGTLTVINSTIAGNTAKNRGGAVYNLGTLHIDQTTFVGNTATATGSFGGAVCSYDHATATIADSIFQGNSAEFGGGVFGYQYATTTIANSELVGNSAQRWGGGLFSHGHSTLTATNLTVGGNAAGQQGGGFYNYSDCTLVLKNSIVALNSAPADPEVFGTLAAPSSHNLVGGDQAFVRDPSDGGDGWGDNSATAEVDESANDDYGDLHLTVDSPAINAGSNALAVDPTGNPLTRDLDGNPRFVSGTIDMGAYEYQGVFYTVNSLADTVADDGLLTLREALQASNTNTALWAGQIPAGSATAIDVITFDPALFTDGTNPVADTITLGGTQLEILDNLQVRGPGAELLTIDAASRSRVLYVSENVEAALGDLTISGGRIIDAEEDDSTDFAGGGICNWGILSLCGLDVSGNSANLGGGIFSSAGALSVADSVVSGNLARVGGAGILNRDSGILTLIDSTVSGNSATDSDSTGGGLLNECAEANVSNTSFSANSAGNGGGIANDGGTLHVLLSTVADNAATSMFWGEGIGGGVLSDEGVMTMTDSDLSGNSANSGGGVFVRRGTAALAQCAIVNNAAQNWGGGITSTAETLTVVDSTFSGNTADFGGGMVSTGTVSITGSTFSTNSANYGGGVCNFEGAMTLAQSTIVDNAATADGGGGYNYAGTLAIADSVLSHNSTTGSGGGVCSSGSGSVLTIANSRISSNHASNGGGILADGSRTVVTNSTVAENVATASGGGIRHLGAILETLQIAGSSVLSNVATDGGGIAVHGTLIVADSTVSGNIASHNGGGIYSSGPGTVGMLDVSGSTISRNWAGADGGAIFGMVGVSIADSAIENNSAASGGGIHASEVLELDNTTLTANSVSQCGGGICSFAEKLTVASSIFAGNTAGTQGGGIYSNGGTLSVANSVFVGNSAENNGGGILASASTLTLTNSTVTANVAAARGGGIYGAGSTLLLANSILGLNHAPSGSDLYGILGAGSGAVLLGTDPGFVRNPSAGDDSAWGTADDDYGNLRLRADSLAINSGSNALAIDAEGRPLGADLDGDPRIIYDTVDIGAYEFRLIADANIDGTVNQLDAAVLASHWGMSGMGWTDGDFNKDGVVNAVDAAILAANWGSAVRSEAEEPLISPEPFVGPIQANPITATRRLVQTTARGEAAAPRLDGSVNGSASEKAAAASDIVLAKGYGPQQDEGTGLDRHRLAWSYALARRNGLSHERDQLRTNPLAVEMLFADDRS